MDLVYPVLSDLQQPSAAASPPSILNPMMGNALLAAAAPVAVAVTAAATAIFSTPVSVAQRIPSLLLVVAFNSPL